MLATQGEPGTLFSCLFVGLLLACFVRRDGISRDVNRQDEEKNKQSAMAARSS